MRESADFDTLDLLLVTALQTAPRADWHRIGRALDVSASTAARRWARLTDAGLAWLSCHPLRLPGAAAFAAVIEVDCHPGRLRTVAERIAEDPHVFTVSQTTGSRDLLITAAFADHPSLARYLSSRLGNLYGVTATRAQVATTVYSQGGRWRLDRLDEQRRTVLTRGSSRTAPAARTALDATDAVLMSALGEDCRRSAADLAMRTGLSPTTVRRRIAHLEAGQHLVYRCEVARFAAGWPVSLMYWCTVPPPHTARVTAHLIGLRETRLCASVSGPANLMLGVWLRGMDDLQPFEAGLAAKVPDLTTTERAVNLWPMKLGGHLLDPYGRKIRSIPMSLWTDPSVTP